MIDLTALARVRMRGSTRIHATTKPGSRETACGKHVHLEWCGKRWDQAHEPEAAVTCLRCQRLTRGQP